MTRGPPPGPRVPNASALAFSPPRPQHRADRPVHRCPCVPSGRGPHLPGAHGAGQASGARLRSATSVCRGAGTGHGSGTAPGSSGSPEPTPWGGSWPSRLHLHPLPMLWEWRPHPRPLFTATSSHPVWLETVKGSWRRAVLQACGPLRWPWGSPNMCEPPGPLSCPTPSPGCGPPFCGVQPLSPQHCIPSGGVGARWRTARLAVQPPRGCLLFRRAAGGLGSRGGRAPPCGQHGTPAAPPSCPPRPRFVPARPGREVHSRQPRVALPRRRPVSATERGPRPDIRTSFDLSG